MSKQTINIGTIANDGTGDPLRTAFDKCNDNFTELYTSPTISGTVLHGDGTDNLRYQEILSGNMPFAIRFYGGYADIGGSDDVNWSIQFNEERVAGHPTWSENIEVAYNTGSQILIEKNWDYQSVDGLVTYRPFGFSLDIATHEAAQQFIVGSFIVGNRTDDPLLTINTLTGVATVLGRMIITNLDAAFPVGITGPIADGSALSIYPTSASVNANLISVQGPVVAGDYNSFNMQGTATASYFQMIQRNFNGGVREILWASGSMDAYVYALSGATECSWGLDKSATAFRVDFADTLGGNTALSVDAATKAFKVVGAFAANNKAPSTPALTSSTTLTQLMQALGDIGLIDYTP